MAIENKAVLKSNRQQDPIGIFDSGIGGLTVAQAVSKVLPNEQLIYFGDTAHVPYGDKSTAAIQAYSVKIADVLLRRKCKLILIACNSASAAAYELVKEYVASRAHVMNVIDPVVQYLQTGYDGQKVGLIGTKQTIGSNVYRHKIDNCPAQIDLRSVAAPLLAPMIEEGFHEKDLAQLVVNEYLQHPKLSDIDAIILGCTHYPLIKPQIDAYFQNRVNIIDSAQVVAEAVKEYLQFSDMVATNRPGENHFMVSDYTPAFEAATRIFFEQKVELEKYPLWD
jgi:glutamate racemase